MMIARIERTLGATLLFAMLAATPAQAQGVDSSFRWTGPATEGSWITVRNMNGSVRVEGADVAQVEVRATKRWDDGDPGRVSIEVTRVGMDGRDILVCAVWTDDTVCTDETYNVNHRGPNDTKVDFVVRVPRAMHVGAHSVNGGIRVSGTSGRINAGTVNGGVHAVSTGGPVTGSTVNGNVYARMGDLGRNEDLRFATVNGDIDVEFSGDLDADILVSTLNGRFESNVPITVQGRVNPRRMRAVAGRGGRDISFSTINGRIELRRL